ncbi:MAG: FliH/SctL family protein [Pseudomonadota bacterium]
MQTKTPKKASPFERLDSFLQKDPSHNLDKNKLAMLESGVILQKAKEKAAFIEQKAYEKGYAQGEKDGFEFGKQKFAMALQNLTRIIGEIDSSKAALYEKSEEEMIGLVLVVARKVIQYEASLSPEVIRKALRTAMNHVMEGSKVVIRVHPYDFRFIDDIKNDFLKEVSRLQHAEIIEDMSIRQGGCLVETEFGDIDATVDGQIAVIEDAVEAIFKGLRK